MAELDINNFPTPEEPKTETRSEVEQVLLDRGVRLNIGGCGCCGSPWVKIEIDGNVIVDANVYYIEMIPETK